MIIVISVDGKPRAADVLVMGAGWFVSDQGNGVVRIGGDHLGFRTNYVTRHLTATPHRTLTRPVSKRTPRTVTVQDWVTRPRDRVVSRSVTRGVWRLTQASRYQTRTISDVHHVTAVRGTRERTRALTLTRVSRQENTIELTSPKVVRTLTLERILSATRERSLTRYCVQTRPVTRVTRILTRTTLAREITATRLVSLTRSITVTRVPVRVTHPRQVTDDKICVTRPVSLIVTRLI